MKMERFQLLIPKWLKYELENEANYRGISLSEHIRDALKARNETKEQRKS